MNIIYLHSHDTGRYLQPYGHAVPAPNLQRLAEDGVLFRRAFNAAPTCSPSRACLLTGQSAHSCGQLGLANRDFYLQHPERHLANFLRSHGYRTALCGFQHLVLDSRTLGYEWIAEVNPPASESANNSTAAAVEFINQEHDQPFFLAVALLRDPPRISGTERGGGRTLYRCLPRRCRIRRRPATIWHPTRAWPKFSTPRSGLF